MYICVCTYICIYIYMYMCVYIHIYIYTYRAPGEVCNGPRRRAFMQWAEEARKGRSPPCGVLDLIAHKITKFCKLHLRFRSSSIARATNVFPGNIPWLVSTFGTAVRQTWHQKCSQGQITALAWVIFFTKVLKLVQVIASSFDRRCWIPKYLVWNHPHNLFPARLYGEYSMSPFFRPISTRWCFTMTNMFQVCSTLLWA